MCRRNQPCTCGSNIKYKKCCGNAKMIDRIVPPAKKEVLLNLINSHRMIEAELLCRELLESYPQSSNLLNLLGITLKEQNKFKEAELVFDRATKIKPDYASAYCNRGITLRYHGGRLEEAVESMRIALEKAPDDIPISDSLINLLNHYLPKSKTDFKYVKAQRSLQKVDIDYSIESAISDETVCQIYKKCSEILNSYSLDIHTNKNQLYRGRIIEEDCDRHKMIFNNFRIIPEYCFNCYKVVVEPRTVMELFKLFLLFDKIGLKDDNTRKCIVEVRKNIAGKYKGFVYCKGRDDGKEVLNVIKPLIAKAVSPKTPVFLKRGCSEFSAEYPRYGSVFDNETEQMDYQEEWRNNEASADENLITQLFVNPDNLTHNHPGFTLLDILVMRKWIAYAEKIDDLSYRQFL